MSVYFCPTAGEIEQQPGGGFDTCCDAPEKHIPITVDFAISAALLAAYHKGFQDSRHWPNHGLPALHVDGLDVRADWPGGDDVEGAPV